MSTTVREILSAASAVLWDFDGVLLDSMAVRDAAFRHVLRDYPTDKVETLVAWHRLNGGLSRYVKFRRFRREIVPMPEDEAMVQAWASAFSDYCKKNLLDANLRIPTTHALLPHLADSVPMHIVSGSDGVELRALCAAHELTQFFKSIEGSPTPKNDLVAGIMQNYGYAPVHTWLIGDSQNDLEAARHNGLQFMGFGNPDLAAVADAYWEG